jgi:four helix bundle protein
MAGIKKFEDIEAWKTARRLTNLVYTLSDQGSFARDFGLRDQIRRASVSIMSNIAEGFESQTQGRFIQFLGYSKASSAEVRSQLYIALDRSYISKEEFDKAFDLADKAARQISRLRSYLESHPRSRQIREGEIYYQVEK